MIEEELGAVEQHPEHVRERLIIALGLLRLGSARPRGASRRHVKVRHIALVGLMQGVQPGPHLGVGQQLVAQRRKVEGFQQVVQVLREL